jgi:hypothetical protein
VKEQPSGPVQRDAYGLEVDTSAAHPARLHNYLAGGDDNFSADRVVAHYLSEVVPGGVETARANVQAMADFMGRAVEYVAGVGVRQFLAVGAPIPTGNDIHVVARRVVPESRVVYVGSDPVVLAHAHELRRSGTAGATAYVHGRLHDPEGVLREAGNTLDLTRPVAVMLLGTLNLVPDDRDPYGIVAELMQGVPSGSHLVVAHATNDIPAEGMSEAATRLAETIGATYVVRTHAEVLRFFTGLELVDPGLVQVDQWHPQADDKTPGTSRLIPIYAAVARNP